MNTHDTIDMMKQTIEELSDANSLKGLFHQHRDGNPMPSNKALEEIIELARAILFPGFFGRSTVNVNTDSTNYLQSRFTPDCASPTTRSRRPTRNNANRETVPQKEQRV